MIRMVIRVHRKNSAFVYSILESLEGMASFSTINEEPGVEHRELELHIPKEFVDDVTAVIDGMRKKFPIIEIERTG
jgi:hypothetical protein